MEKQKRTAIITGLFGLIVMMLGLKYMPLFYTLASSEVAVSSEPVILFFNEDEPCECMVELTASAEKQISEWPLEQRAGIEIVRYGFRQRQDLEAKFKVFRAPCLVLLDPQGNIVWRQDYPLIEGGPFKLRELEEAITVLGDAK